MFLKLTTVSFHGTGKKQTSMVRDLRINFDKIESYFEAPDDMRNNVSEQAKCNTILMVSGDNDKAYHAKETVEQIDDMIGSYGCEKEEDVKQPPIEVKINTDGWSDWK